jgi:sugar O-acyltransferase (sialic acid O-acetyltransferase NeuD family)
VKLAILGAGGLAREVRSIVNDLAADGEDLEVVGFIDVAPAPGAELAGLPVLGDESWFTRREARGVRAVPALGAPAIRRRSVAAARAAGARFETVVHPTVSRGRNVRVGIGCILLPCSSLTTDVDVQDFVSINPGCTLGHDVVVEPFVNLSPGTRLSGYVRVSEGADLGAGAIVLPNRTVGAGAVLGAGAVAIRDVAPGVTVVGVPARPLERPS